MQDVQKGLPAATARRVLGKREAEAYCFGYAEASSAAIDPLQQWRQRVPRLAAFFNILPVGAGW